MGLSRSQWYEVQSVGLSMAPADATANVICCNCHRRDVYGDLYLCRHASSLPYSLLSEGGNGTLLSK